MVFIGSTLASVATLIPILHSIALRPFQERGQQEEPQSIHGSIHPVSDGRSQKSVRAPRASSGIRGRVQVSIYAKMHFMVEKHDEYSSCTKYPSHTALVNL